METKNKSLRILKYNKYKLAFNHKCKRFIIQFTALLILLFNWSCKTEESVLSDGSFGVVITPTTNGFYAAMLNFYPLSVYIDNSLKLTYSRSPIQVEGDCMNVDFQIKLPRGPHSFTFVTPDGHYLEGTFTISSGSCSFNQLLEDYFQNSKVNYGTNNGTITFTRNSLLYNHTLLYVDGKYVGDLTQMPYFQLCGVGDGVSTIAVALPPGIHSYNAIDSENNRVWSGNITVTPNSCFQQTLLN